MLPLLLEAMQPAGAAAICELQQQVQHVAL
jgi:hypothetical protein